MRLHPGEVEATGWRVEKLADVLRRIREAAPDVAGRPRVIAIDGRGGAGKSTLVERLRALVPASEVVHTDDVAWNQAYFDWGDLMVENILRPLHRGEGVEFRPPAWIEHDRPGAIRVPAGADVVWVEGTGIIRQELARWTDSSIWLQGDLDEQERRLVARDGDSAAQRRHIAAWLAEELPLMLREQPWAKATIVVAGTTELDFDPHTEIVVASGAQPSTTVCSV
jgi:ABC-type cobalamin/Fe3+-siderophores transport system ATPase subunit